MIDYQSLFIGQCVVGPFAAGLVYLVGAMTPSLIRYYKARKDARNV